MPSKYKTKMDISIIIPYNKDRGYLSEAVKSCENQDFKGTFEIIQEKGNYNVAINRNDAIKKAKGEYIKLLDEDDLLPPNSLTDLYNNRDNNDLTIGDFYTLWNGKYNPVVCIIPILISDLAVKNTIAYGSILYRKESILQVGGFNEKLVTGEDFELTLRLADNGCKFSHVDSIVFGHRIHKEQKTDAYYRVNVNWCNRRKVLIDQIRSKYINNHKKIVR